MSDAKLPRAGIRFLFNVCNDVEAMRHFYVGLLGMEQAAFMNEEQFGWLALQCDGFQAMWFRGDESLPVPTEFACQPGWPGGTLETTSWGVFIPEERFAAVYEALRDAGVTLFEPVPAWRQDCYWGLSALDPVGSTVEVYTNPAERPAETTWPAG
jgi:catechol 2,3-dioxygenase-like lactoylglutathione lyase family enzyme